MDALLAPLFDETVGHYRDLAEFGFALPAEPTGLLVLSADEALLDEELALIGDGFPELGLERLAPGEPHRLEPVVAPDLAGVRIATGYAVPPAEATHAFLRRAEAAGAKVVLEPAGADAPADAVVLAAGPWTPALADPSGAWRPIEPLWGVNVEIHLPAPPRHAVEEAGIDALLAEGGGEDGLFSLVTAQGVSSLGSTFLADEPDPAERAPLLRQRGVALRAGAGGRRDRLGPRLRAAAVGRRAAAAGPPRRPRRSPRGTARGGSRSGRPRRGWWRTSCSAASRRSRRSSTRRASAARRRRPARRRRRWRACRSSCRASLAPASSASS